MVYYMVSFDLEDSCTHDYDFVYKSMEKTFPNFCKILSTTCLIKTDSTCKEIREWFKNCVDNKNNISIFVAQYDYSTYWINKSIKENIKKLK